MILPPQYKHKGQAWARWAANALSRNKMIVFVKSIPQVPAPLLHVDTYMYAAPPVPQMDIIQFEENVSLFLALAPVTLRSYRSWQTRYLQFCQDVKLRPLPLSEQVLCMLVHVAHLDVESLAYQRSATSQTFVTTASWQDKVTYLGQEHFQYCSISPGVKDVTLRQLSCVYLLHHKCYDASRTSGAACCVSWLPEGRGIHCQTTRTILLSYSSGCGYRPWEPSIVYTP